jgi:hypothetical protein
MFAKAASEACVRALAQWLVRHFSEPNGFRVGIERLPQLAELFVQSILGIRWQLNKALVAKTIAELKVRAYSQIDREKAYVEFREWWYTRVVGYYRLRYLANSPAVDKCKFSHNGVYDLDMDDSCAIGFHHKEQSHEGSFRWSRPVAAIRMNLEPGEYSLTVNILQHREDLCDAHVEAYFDNELLNRKHSEDPNQLCWSITPTYLNRSNVHFVVFVCTPFKPVMKGISDTRELGIPVTSVAIEAVEVQKQLSAEPAYAGGRS